MTPTTKTVFIFFVIFVIEHGTHCLSSGYVTAESRLIFQRFYNHSGLEDAIAQLTERIKTDEDINAIRGMDVSGQNGDAVIPYFNPRNIEIVIWSDGIGKGFNYSLELYTNSKTGGDGVGGGVGARSVSMCLIAISILIGLLCCK